MLVDEYLHGLTIALLHLYWGWFVINISSIFIEFILVLVFWRFLKEMIQLYMYSLCASNMFHLFSQLIIDTFLSVYKLQIFFFCDLDAAMSATVQVTHVCGNH